jgi:hypothetical protein
LLAKFFSFFNKEIVKILEFFFPTIFILGVKLFQILNIKKIEKKSLPIKDGHHKRKKI